MGSKKQNSSGVVDYKIKKEVIGLKDKKGFFKLNKQFIEDLILNDKKMLEANIYVHRILANIGLSLKNEQFYIDNENFQMKLNLFDEEFLTEDNAGILFKMNTIEICKGGNYAALEEALNTLESHHKQWYTSINSKGETIRSLGGLISNPILNKNTGNFQFFITSHWLKKLLHLTEYNQTYYRLALEISSNKQMMFWYWLTILPREGTKVNFQTLNERFDLNYKSARDICKGFLNPVKSKFDALAHISFNYSYKGNLINIAKYTRTAEEFKVLNEIKPSEFEDLKRKYKISYIAKRHNLTDKQIGSLSQVLKFEPLIFLESYKDFVSSCRKQKRAATTYIQDDFIKEFQNHIIETYRNSQKGKHYPNGYPILNV